MRGFLVGVFLVTLVTVGTGCSLFTEKQQPFPALDITAKRPPPGPDRVVLLPSTIVISDKVQFEVGKAELLPVSHSLLDEVVKVMKDNPQIEEVQVEGHTDSTGSAEINKRLSQERAESVVKYLVKQGVKRDRLTARGFGPDKPIADNADAAGQEMNRRVEFNITKQGPIKKVIKDE